MRNSDMFRLWSFAEQDLLSTSSPYRLRDTGQGLNRVQYAPKTARLMQLILQRAQKSIGYWVGSRFAVYPPDKHVINLSHCGLQRTTDSHQCHPHGTFIIRCLPPKPANHMDPAFRGTITFRMHSCSSTNTPKFIASYCQYAPRYLTYLILRRTPLSRTT